MSRTKGVTAVELDKKMCAVVKTACIKYNNLRVENQDILKFETLGLGQYKMVSNVPYYITSAVIKSVLSQKISRS